MDLMKTKQEYQEALNRMEETYYNLGNSMGAMSRFKEDVNLLAGLVNEHFEEKSETNLEFYYDDLLEEGFSDFGVVNGKIKSCAYIPCEKCEFEGGNCHKNRITWLKSKCKKPTYKLSQFEYDLLNAYKNSGMRQCIPNYGTLLEMYGKGHFKSIDTSTPIHEILDNCEVMD